MLGRAIVGLIVALSSAWPSAVQGQIVVGGITPWPYGVYGGPFYGGYYGSGYYDPYSPYLPAPYYLGSDAWPYPLGPYTLPPVFADAGSLYGPQAVQRFMGIGQQGGGNNLGGNSAPPLIARPQPAPGAAPAGAAAANQPAPAAIEPKNLKIKPSNAEARARARKFIEFGDAHFAKGKYHDAVQRYRMASEAAADLAESYLRQAHALAAMGQYDFAAQATRRGLAVKQNWNASPIKLDDIYGAGVAEKTAHLEALAGAVEAEPQKANLYLLIGLSLWFDGQQDRARVFFTRCAELGGNEDRLLDGFLTPPAAPGK